MAESFRGESFRPEPLREGRKECCSWYSTRRSCVCCYRLQFFLYLIMFPAWCKFMHSAPIPKEFWGEQFPHKFPVISDLNMAGLAGESKMNVSSIPTEAQSCDNTCGLKADGGHSSSMSFPVRISVDASSLLKSSTTNIGVLYPVLLSSSDWKKWYLVADRTDARPMPFFRSSSPFNRFQFATEPCSAPMVAGPKSGGVAPVSPVSKLMYVLACVTWDAKSVGWLADPHKAIKTEDIRATCSAVGGACGWLGRGAMGRKAQACDEHGQIDTKAKELFPTLGGGVSVQSCVRSGPRGTCVGGSPLIADWRHHRCSRANFTYDSLPRLLVTTSGDAPTNVTAEDMLAEPWVFVFVSSSLQSGDWVQAYDNQGNKSAPVMMPHVPGAAARRLLRGAPEQTNEEEMALSHKMNASDLSEVDIEPSACLGQTGPLYLVACAVNASTYDTLKDFRHWQEVAGPPFNDRCLAVGGVCGHACQADREAEPMEHCAGGVIDQSVLVNRDITRPRNDGFAPQLFTFVLIIGFMVKVLTLCPSVFEKDSHFSHYRRELSDSFQSIVTCSPSAGENKRITMRNIVGCVAAMPREVNCRYHVILLDEGHRHAMKECWGALTEVIKRVQSVEFRGDPPRGHKAVPDFFAVWCRTTRDFRLDELGKKPVAPGDKALRRLSGEEALQTMLAGSWSRATKNSRDNLQAALQHLRRHLENDGQARPQQQQQQGQAAKGRGAAAPALPATAVISGVLLIIVVAIVLLVVALHPEPASSSLTLGASAATGIAFAIVYLNLHAAGPQLRVEPDMQMNLLQQDRAEPTAGASSAGAAQASSSAGPDMQMECTPKHVDDCKDWPERNDESAETSSGLVLHYLARANPDEDDRANRSQGLQPGVWCYEMPLGRQAREWLSSRRRAAELRYAEQVGDVVKVPLRTSRGKAGGLNFAMNYMVVWNEGNRGNVVQLDPPKPLLFSIADARHQYQPDFMRTTIPYFFRQNGEDWSFDSEVKFTQCPQYFPEQNDATDFLDTNNATFFRLNCMIRNCCGGVSSCGTNGTWVQYIKRDDNNRAQIWDREPVRVVNRALKATKDTVEVKYFHEDCKVEDTASSLRAVLENQRSQYVNRKLSYGMAKEPTGYLAATQRWAEGGVTLSMQTMLHNRDDWIWFGFLFFLAMLGWLEFLVAADMELPIGLEQLASWLVARVCDAASDYTTFWDADCPLVWLPVLRTCVWWGLTVVLVGLVVNYSVRLMSWLIRCLPRGRCRAGVQAVTRCLYFRTNPEFKFTARSFARVLIGVDNLTYFIWFWTAFFWVGFNYYTALSRVFFHFKTVPMMSFMLAILLLDYGITGTLSFRYNLDQAEEANEITEITSNNKWRSTQLFYMAAPVQLYSILCGIAEFKRWRYYGIDISWWSGGDRGDVAIMLVKWWTLMLVVGPIVAWAAFAVHNHQYANTKVGCIVVTIIGFDMLIPCTYLWVGNVQLSKAEDEAAKTWVGALTTWRWWLKMVSSAVLGESFAAVFRKIGPAFFLLQPILVLMESNFGVNSAFMLVAGTQQR